MSFDGFPTLPDHVNARFKTFMSGDLPPAHLNMGIRPDLWCKEAEVGRVLFRWPNDGSRAIGGGLVFGCWFAGLSAHVVPLCMFSALAEGQGFSPPVLLFQFFRQ